MNSVPYQKGCECVDALANIPGEVGIILVELRLDEVKVELTPPLLSSSDYNLGM